jgi:hypothetical protein
MKTDVLKSAHNYANNTNETKVFTVPGAEYINITFSSLTSVEDDYDYIYVYDGADEPITINTNIIFKIMTQSAYYCYIRLITANCTMM